MTASMRRLMALAATALLAACESPPPRPAVEAPLPPMPQATACDRLTALAGPELRLEATKLQAADARRPAHCEVTAVLRERTGADGQRYAIGMHLRLPMAWNGRFVFQGQGGTDGVLGDGDAQPGGGSPSALNQGYATVTTDAGHTNRPGPLGSSLFGLDPQARIDFGHAALDAVARTSKRFIEAFYGAPARYAYFIGCSNGGRHGMVAAQRFPQHFDGIAAGAPGMRMPEKGLSGAAATRALAAVAPRAADGRPILSQALSPGDMQLVARSVLQACDGLDGLVDGIIGRPQACRFSPAVLQCTGAKTPQCLTAGQVGALDAYFSGPVLADGRRIYAPYPYDAGVATDGWRRWILGTSTDGKPNALNPAFGASLALVYMTPPEPLSDDPLAVYDFYRSVDLDAAHRRMFATAPGQSESAAQAISANSVDLSGFKARGGRMILYHGVSDPTFSALDTVDWYVRLDRQERGAAERHARLFLVPGMNHCAGGPATDSFDVLAPLVAWVEQGRAPARIEARASAAAPWPQRTRPLCPYPRYARHTGMGSTEAAGNFSCERP